MLDRPQITSRVQLRRELNQRLGDFMEVQRHALLQELFEEWRHEGWNAFIFGGLLRDLMICGAHTEPRDIDVVVTNRSLEQLRTFLAQYIVRETRFGGLHVHIAGTNFDIWPLKKTWAFGHHLDLPPTLTNLPKTTFLNVEGLVSQLPKKGIVPRVYEYGFLRAFNTGELDINLEENPFPALAAVRALLTAQRLHFTMSLRLSKYIIETVNLVGIDALIVAQRNHYADIILSSGELVQAVIELKSSTAR